MTKLYNKPYDFSFRIVNFPFIYDNIPSKPGYEVFIAQFMSYARDCRNYGDFLNRDRPLELGYVAETMQTFCIGLEL